MTPNSHAELIRRLFPRASEDTIKANGLKTCIGCGKEFTPSSRCLDAVYCSQVCAASTIGKRTMKANRKVVPKTKWTELKCAQCGKPFSSWKSNGRKYCSSKCSADNLESKHARVSKFNSANMPTAYSRSKKSWVELGDRRFFARSKWEAYYGFYLEWLRTNGHIKDWKYEAKRFTFKGIQRGTISYLPDFEVTENDGQKVYHEVKGWMDAKSATRLKRMKKYHPEIKLELIMGDWFSKNKLILSLIAFELFRENSLK